MNSLVLLLRYLAAFQLCNIAATQSLANSFFSEPDTNAGFITRINQKALDLFAAYLKERVDRFMFHGEIPFNLSAPLTDEVSFRLSFAHIAHFDSAAFQSQFVLLPGQGLMWLGSQFTSSIGAIFKVFSPGVELIGNSNLNIQGAKVELHLTTNINADGHLKTDLLSCKVYPGQVTMNFSQTDTVVLSNYLGHINRFATERIEQVLCSSFHAELIPVVSNRLMNTPMSAALFEQYFINYGLLEPVRYWDHFIELRHRGNSFGILRQGRNRLNDFRLPFRSAPLHAPPESHGMVDFYLSNYTMSSLLFWMDQYRKFDYEISKESVNNPALAGYLRTDCGTEDVCAGTLFPALAAKFPKGIVQIKTHTTTYPQLLLEDGKALIFIESRVDALVQQVDRTRRFLNAGMSAELLLKKPTFRSYTLNAEMRIEKFRVHNVVSLVDGIDATSLEFLVSALNELIIADDIAKKLHDGIRLPILFDFNQESSEVIFEKDRIRISSNYCATQGCNAISESKDDVDYYDSVHS